MSLGLPATASAEPDTFSLFQEFAAQREEILKHKWIESEKLGFDIGWEAALTDWVFHHRQQWAAERHDTERFEAHERQLSPAATESSVLSCRSNI